MGRHATSEGKLDLALKKAWETIGDGVWVKMVREDGTEDPAQEWSFATHLGSRGVDLTPVTFSYERETQLGTGTYTAVRWYGVSGEFLTEIRFQTSKMVLGSSTKKQRLGWWQFWREPTLITKPGDTLTVDGLGAHYAKPWEEPLAPVADLEPYHGKAVGSF